MLICAPKFHMSLTDYSQVSSNCDQLLTAVQPVLTQVKLLYTSDASALTKDSVHASAQILSYQMTTSTRSSNSVRALLSSAASTDSVTGVNIQMLINMIQQFTEVVATAVSMPSTCESLICH